MQPPNDILNFIDSATSKNTFEKTRSDVKKVKEFLAGEHESRDLDEITSDELDLLLSRFFINSKTQKGEDYEPSTLKGFQTSVQRYL